MLSEKEAACYKCSKCSVSFNDVNSLMLHITEGCSQLSSTTMESSDQLLALATPDMTSISQVALVPNLNSASTPSHMSPMQLYPIGSAQSFVVSPPVTYTMGIPPLSNSTIVFPMQLPTVSSPSTTQGKYINQSLHTDTVIDMGSKSTKHGLSNRYYGISIILFDII